jgi:DNA-binding CsgD family transcriptional regulator
MNFKSKDIANVLNISENSVNKSRQRLRKKLNLPPASDISSYIKKNLQ